MTGMTASEYYEKRDALRAKRGDWGGVAINVINPSDRDWTRHRYLLTFGVIGSTFVLVNANGLEDAIETAAEWLAEHGFWGHITPHDVRDDLGCDCDDPFDCESHTYTESGWLTSHEWFATEDPTNEALRALNKGDR